MTTTLTRSMKEAGALWLPWCVVMALCSMPLLSTYVDIGRPSLFFTILGFALGLPLLATLPFGNEFKNHTLNLLLSQPVDRMNLWWHKWVATVFAVLSSILPVTLLWYLNLVRPSYQLPNDLMWIGAFSVMMTIGSAAFWTLTARSTLGGWGLNISVQFFIFLSTSPLWDIAFVRKNLGDVKPYPILFVLALAYALVSLWLGRRKLARFQTTGQAVGPDLMTAAPNLLPRSIARIFHARPDQPILNVIRKELHLLRPLWLITAVYVLGCGAMISWISLNPSPMGRTFNLQMLLSVTLAAFPWVAMALAGCVSMGEERTSGTQSWHQTLPLSIPVQWWIKLLVGLSSAIICGGLIPIGLAFLARDVQAAQLKPAIESMRIVSPELLGVFILGFWSACLVRGTTSASLMMAIAGTLLFSLAQIGVWASGQHNPFAGIVANQILAFIARFQLNPFLFSKYGLNFNPPPYRSIWNPEDFLWMLPMLGLAIVQSYRLFRVQNPGGARWIMRKLLPISAVYFLTVFTVGFAGSQVLYLATSGLFLDVGHAVVAVQPDVTTLDSSHPLKLTAVELTAATSMASQTRRWLEGAMLTISTIDEAGHRKYDAIQEVSRPPKGRPSYLVTIELARGASCSLRIAYSEYTAKYDFVADSRCE